MPELRTQVAELLATALVRNSSVLHSPFMTSRFPHASSRGLTPGMVPLSWSRDPVSSRVASAPRSTYAARSGWHQLGVQARGRSMQMRQKEATANLLGRNVVRTPSL